MFHVMLPFMGIIVGFAVMFLLVFVMYYIWQVLKQILYCFNLYSLTNDKRSFIPVYNQYIFGQAGVNKIFGMVLLVVSGLKLFIDLWVLDVLFEENLLVYNLFPNISLLFAILVFGFHVILSCVCASKIFEKECNKIVYIVLTLLSYLSLGALIPVFLFFINKIKKKSR